MAGLPFNTLPAHTIVCNASIACAPLGHSLNTAMPAFPSNLRQPRRPCASPQSDVSDCHTSTCDQPTASPRTRSTASGRRVWHGPCVVFPCPRRRDAAVKCYCEDPRLRDQPVVQVMRIGDEVASGTIGHPSGHRAGGVRLETTSHRRPAQTPFTHVGISRLRPHLRLISSRGG